MTVNFPHIPTNLRTPLFFADLDPSRANTAANVQRTLIIGQKTNLGTGTVNVPVRSQGITDAKIVGGPGSILAVLNAAYRKNDAYGEVWFLPLADDGSGTAASGSIAFTGPSTAAGTLSLYIAGLLISTAISVGMTAAQVATAVAAAITAAPDVIVNATVDGTVASQVNLVAKNKGLCGNDTDIRLNYLGTAGGEATPAGLGATIVALTGGATNPSLTTALANLGDTAFDFVVSPYTDATSLAAMANLFNDASGRWSWLSQLYGGCFIGYKGSSGTLTTFGVTQNDQHTCCIGVYDSPSPAWRWAAAIAGAAAPSLRADPGVPLQTLSVLGVLPPPVQSRFGLTIRNTLLFAGISTYTVDTLGNIAIDNLITTYQTNAQGAADNSYLELETMYLLAFVLRRLRSVVTTKFARSKLAADGTRPLPGSNVVTPSTIKGELIACYRQLEAEGMVQQSDVFAANVVVEKASTPGRVNVVWPGILIEQLRVFALLAQFRNN